MDISLQIRINVGELNCDLKQLKFPSVARLVFTPEMANHVSFQRHEAYFCEYTLHNLSHISFSF